MKNYWPNKFNDNSKLAAITVLEEQAKMLPNLTKGTVYAEVSNMDEYDTLVFDNSFKNDFCYRFDIKGKFLDNYSFNVLKFSHDITFYPVQFNVDEKIGIELNLTKKVFGYYHEVKTPDDLDAFLTVVLSSNRLKDVIGSIMRLSNK